MPWSGGVRSLPRLAERWLPLLVLATSIAAVPALIFAKNGLPRLRALEAERNEVQVEVSRLGDQIRMLRSEVQRLKDEPSEVERVARDQLGLVRQTEIVFQFSN